MSTQPIGNWSAVTRQTFRFFGLYFIIYLYTTYFFFLWDPLVKKAGQSLGLWKDITVWPNGSGDTTYNYLQVLCMLIAAFSASLGWWLLDNKRKSYNTLQYWVMAFLRYGLAYYMISYGFAKIFKSQFPFPTLATLVKPYGDATPMNLAWTFMGYSTGFNLFTGIAEALGGCFLLFRRTTMFGCLFSMTVLSNIVAMNFCYDIPVKLFSVHLLLIAVFICIPYMPRLFKFFLSDSELPKFKQHAIYKTKGDRTAHIVFKCLILCFIAFTQLGYFTAKDRYNKKPPLYGLYETDVFVLNGDTSAHLVSNKNMWRYLAIDWPGRAYVQTMNGKGRKYDTITDTVAKTIMMSDDSTQLKFRYSIIEESGLYLTGTDSLKNTFSISMHGKSIDSFRLVKTSFHWINEYPNNR